MYKLKLKYSLAIFSLIMLFPVSISSEEIEKGNTAIKAKITE